MTNKIKEPEIEYPPIKNIYEHGKEDNMDDKFLERQSTLVSQSDENKELANIKGKMFLARQFPRNTEVAVQNIIAACNNPKLAAVAIYSYPKGGQEVRGPSIRLAEAVAQHWGNFLCGMKELERFTNKAIVSAYAWDLETNFQDEKVFEVSFIRNTKNGSYLVTDEREKYEMVANYAARRKRACILAVIPSWVFDMAMDACEATLKNALSGDGKDKKSIEELRASTLETFKQFGEWITDEVLATYFGKKFEAIDFNDIVKLKHLYHALKDGFTTAEKVFGRETESVAPSLEETEQLGNLVDKVKSHSKKATKEEKADGKNKAEETVGAEQG